MDIVTLLDAFADPVLLEQMSFAEKMFAGLVTTILGMGITFVALIVLQMVIGLLGRFAQSPAPGPGKAVIAVSATARDDNDDEVGTETVAAITVALSVLLKTTPDNLVIREIKRVADVTPVWGRVGVVEQLRDPRR